MANALFRIPSSKAVYDAALEGLVRIDERIIEGGGVPRLYDSGARYRRERQDVWRHAGDVAVEGYGDCEDLAAYRAAELRVSGEDPGAYAYTYETGPRRYHAVVGRSDGSMEDPSLALGMKLPRRIEQMIRDQGPMCGIVDSDASVDGLEDGGVVTVDIYRSGKGWSGVVRFPMMSGKTIQATTSVAPTQQGAEKKATNTAMMLATELAKTAIPLVPGASQAMAVLSNPLAQEALKVGATALSKIPGVSTGISALKSLF
jgi:hypothetical protein